MIINSRRKAREACLQLLYQSVIKEDWSDQEIKLCQDIFFEASEEELIFGVIKNLTLIDKLISKASNHWSISRMAIIDLNILRLATYEIAFIDEIPTNVSLNEAIELAKLYGSEDSSLFVNGVLDKIAEEIKDSTNLKNKKVA
ncbi:UNVERIFIED_CONTAM: hypothetical protein GTU68_025292 [Idotea baltica]|nr:hypothetical protein [Idotea baltica]